MKKIFLVSVLILIGLNLFAQEKNKHTIDSLAIANWPTLGDRAISNDGNYFSYTIRSQPIGKNTLVIKSTIDSWEKRFVMRSGFSENFFSADNKTIVFKRADTLYFAKLGSEELNFIANVSSFKIPKLGNGEWLAYQLKSDSNVLVLFNMISGKKKTFAFVSDYNFENTGNILVVKSLAIQDSLQKTILHLVRLNDYQDRVIWDSEDSINSKPPVLSNYVFDGDSKQFLFVVKKTTNGKEDNSIWYYKVGTERAIIKVNNESDGVEKKLIIDGEPEFSRNAQWIFFLLKSKPTETRSQINLSKVDVWSYKDLPLQPEQMRQGKSKTFSAVIETNNTRVIKLCEINESLTVSPIEITGDWALVNGNYVDPWWRWNRQPVVSLISLKTGKRELIQNSGNQFSNFSFSPNSKYLVYYDNAKQKYFSYNIPEKRVIDISKKIRAKLNLEGSDIPGRFSAGPIAGWVENEKAVLIYDNYDLWQVDPSGLLNPLNITQGYGVSHSIKLRIVYEKNQLRQTPIYSMTETILLTGFNTINKENGFFSKSLNSNAIPELLKMGPFTFYHADSQIPRNTDDDHGALPIKAMNKDSWVVKRQSSTEAPNYYLTSDFKTYKALTDLAPQKNCNWLTAELINYKQLDGVNTQGILYKPENFDPNRKYPVIFNYYRQLSHRLNEFPEPKFTQHDINISWFVSNGYLVFTPDIHYFSFSLKKNGKTSGVCAYNSIIAGANYLSRLPYVDNKRMAIQGHSFGAGETNYIITHTNIFAAAAEASGDSDPISAYLTLVPLAAPFEHFNKMTQIENSIGYTPWESPESWINNSAVMNANKVSKPILIMHNTNDNQVQWRQGVEWYMALRRLGKQTWMLQYDEGDHAVYGKDAIDYTNRLTQFFNHYLKDSAAPVWMTQGVPARLKGIETGYALDSAGSCGPTCKICKKINAIYNKEHGISTATISKEEMPAQKPKTVKTNK